MTTDQLPQAIALVAESIKTSFAPKGAVSHTIVHIHVGLALYLAVCAARRRGLRSRLAIGLLAGVTLASEALDYLTAAGGTRPHWLLVDSIGDALHTLAWPLVLYCGARLWAPRPLADGAT